jgi:asparagine synthase (glutamine-hydrolysing)
MLAASDYRGDTSDRFLAEGLGLGYRFLAERGHRSPGIEQGPEGLCACAGTLAPAQGEGPPARRLLQRLRALSGPDDARSALADLDGAFAAAAWDPTTRRLRLIRDPFGVRSLYSLQQGGTLYFASELKQLLAIPGLALSLDASALHKYLTFSFVPGEAVPIKGVRRLLPGQILTYDAESGSAQGTPYFALTEALPVAADDDGERQAEAVRRLRRLGREAVTRRLAGEAEVGLYLSGGLDSSAVGYWLRESGVRVRALSLDFGEQSVEREQAAEVAKSLGLDFALIPVGGAEVASVFDDLVYRLDLPFGDAVTGPQYLLGQAAHRAGLGVIFNGEGGDQLFGGWTSKPMIAAALFSGIVREASPEELYLGSYHRFYGLEDELYTKEFAAQLGGPGQRRALLSPYLGSPQVGSFLNRVRLADIALKGSQNILPRAERMSSAWGLDIRTPLFDRRLAEFSFAIPPHLKLHGACEKYVFKLAMQGRLPEDIVWRPKSGMSVPITDWVQGPLRPIIDDLLSPQSLRRRGLFRPEYVERLRSGQDEPAETRRRRIGEKLWALAMLEAWLRRFYDRRGARPDPRPAAPDPTGAPR